MEFSNFVMSFNQLFILFSVLSLLSLFIFRNKKDLVSVIISLILLIMINYFVITQKDYIFDNFPKQAYGMLILLFLMYFVFFRDLYLFIKAKKAERDTKIVKS